MRRHKKNLHQIMEMSPQNLACVRYLVRVLVDPPPPRRALFWTNLAGKFTPASVLSCYPTLGVKGGGISIQKILDIYRGIIYQGIMCFTDVSEGRRTSTAQVPKRSEYLFIVFTHIFFPDSGQAVVTGVVPSSPRCLPFQFL